jgi:hypothetical protein
MMTFFLENLPSPLFTKEGYRIWEKTTLEMKEIVKNPAAETAGHLITPPPLRGGG